MSKKPNKRCGAATGGHSPILAKLGEIRINHRAAKTANLEAGALARFYHEQFPLNPAAAVAAHNVNGRVIKARIWRDLDDFEIKLRNLRSEAPANPHNQEMQVELAIFEAAKKALDADIQARLDLIGVANVEDLPKPSIKRVMTKERTPQSEPRNTPSYFECKAAWLDENAPLYWPLVEIAADWKALKAEHDPLSNWVGTTVGPLENEQKALCVMFDKQDDLMRRVEELLKAPPKSASCLYIKVGLLGIFAVYGESDRKADEVHCGYDGCHPSNDALVDATFQLFEHLKTDTETPPDTVRFLIETIQESLI